MGNFQRRRLTNPEAPRGRAKGAYPPATAPIAAKALNMSVSAIRKTSPRVGSRASCGF